MKWNSGWMKKYQDGWMVGPINMAVEIEYLQSLFWPI